MITCPHCTAEHNEDPRNAAPGATDICVVCGEWIITMQPGAVRGPTPREAAAMARIPQFRALRAAWERMQRQIGNQPDSTSFEF